MNTMQRNTFVVGLLVVAAIGLGMVLLAARPQQQSPSDSSAADSLTVTYMQNGQSRSLELRKVAVDAFTGSRFILGSSSAKNTIVEFADYQCPACGLFANQFESSFKTQFIDSGQVRYAFRDFPLPQHQNAPLAAQAAACALAGGGFLNFKAILFRGQAQWSNLSSEAATEQLAEYATFAGLNKSSFLKCLETNNAKDAIATDVEMGRKVGLSATPSFVVNGYLVAGALPPEAFTAILEKVGIQ